MERSGRGVIWGTNQVLSGGSDKNHQKLQSMSGFESAPPKYEAECSHLGREVFRLLNYVDWTPEFNLCGVKMFMNYEWAQTIL